MMRGVLSTIIAVSAAVVLFFAFAVYQQKLQSMDTAAETTQENLALASRASEESATGPETDDTLQQAAASIAPKGAPQQEPSPENSSQQAALEQQPSVSEAAVDATAEMSGDATQVIEQLQKVQQYLINENHQLKDRIARLEQQAAGERVSIQANPQGSVTVIDTGSRSSEVLNGKEYKNYSKDPNGANEARRGGSQQLAGLKN